MKSENVRPGVSGSLRAVPRVVRLITVLWFAVLLTWSLVLPTYRSADEFAHVMGAHYWEYQHSWPDFDGPMRSTAVMRSLPLVGLTRYPPLAADEAPERMPAFADLADPAAIKGQITVGQHPPGYYVLIGTVAGLVPDSAPFDLEVWVLRLVSVLLLTPLPLLAAALARRFTASRRLQVAAAVVPFLIPQLGVLGGSVNNDNLLIPAASLVMLGTALIARGDTGLRTAAWTGVGLAVALLTKAFALVLLPLVGLALVLAWSRSGRRAGPVLRSAAMIGVLAATGLWWWVRNLLVYGSVQPAGHFPALPDGPMDLGSALRLFAGQAVWLVPQRFWAMLSIKTDQQAFPTWIYLVATAVAVVVVVAGLSWCRRTGRPDRILLIAPVVLVGLSTTASTWRLMVRTGEAAGLQGRYLFVGVVGLAVLVVLGGARLLGRRHLLLPVLLFSGGAVFVTVSFVRALGYHWERRGSSVGEALTALLAWSPVGSSATSAVLLSIPVLAVLVLVVLMRDFAGPLRRGGRRPGPGRPAGHRRRRQDHPVRRDHPPESVVSALDRAPCIAQQRRATDGRMRGWR